jgi:hypothetical protein
MLAAKTAITVRRNVALRVRGEILAPAQHPSRSMPVWP